MHRHLKEYPHNRTIETFFDDLKHTKLSGALTALYSNRILQQVASGLVGVFFPILLYTQFNLSLLQTLFYYICSYTITLLIFPLGAMAMSRVGLKNSMIIATVGGFGWYFFVRYFEMSGEILFLGLAIIAINFNRFFYWVPFHTDFAKFTDRRTRGKQLSMLLAVASIISIFIPFVSGSIITQYGYDVLFLVAMIIFALSVFPLFLTPNVEEKFSFGYFQTYRELFKKKNRRMFLSYAADGMQNMVGIVVWPIFIWLLLDKNYQAVGIVSSLIIFASLLLQLLMGNLSDKFSKRKVLKWGSILNSLGWVSKMFVDTGFQIFVASTYHNFANIVMRTPFDALMYEKAADSGHYIDEYTVLRELSLGLGRVFMICIIALIFIFTGSLIGAFFAAAIASLLISVL